MSFDRQKRLLLGVLAFLTPLPLPFNQVVGWGWMICFWAAVGLFLQRSWQGPSEAISVRAMNLLALAYLPVLVADFVWLWNGSLLRPLVHLALFALAAKLFGLRREKEKWHVVLLVFFLFLAAMGSSVHPAVVVYLVSFLAMILLVMARFAGFHVLSAYGVRGNPSQLPLRGFLLTGTLLTVALAAPLFVLLPRLGRPYVVAPMPGASAPGARVGFEDEISLDVIGRVRTSRAVVLRLSYDTPTPATHNLRLRGQTYSEFRGSGWRRSRRESVRVRRGRDGFFHVAPGIPRAWARIWTQASSDPVLVLPVEAVAVDLEAPGLDLDEAGVASAYTGGGGPRSYRVGMVSLSEPVLPISGFGPPFRRDLDQAGVSDGIRGLAARVGGEGHPASRAKNIETFLMSEYEYTLDLVGGASLSPVDDFLFEWRRGHCEYFASAMVLMLRSQGIAARLVTGFLGAEFNPFEGYFIVRQSNAHAWVEAYLPEEGWRLFDPTPAAGRPQIGAGGWGLIFTQAYDYLIFRWDRYVLTYGFYDQLDLARRLRSLWMRLRGRPDQAPVQGEGLDDGRSPSPDAAPTDAAAPAIELDPWEWLALAGLALVSGWWVWRHRPLYTATRAYRALRKRLRAGPLDDLPSSAPPMAVAQRLARLHPAAAAPGGRVIALYLRESFGGEDLSEEERRDVEARLRDAMRAMRSRR